MKAPLSRLDLLGSWQDLSGVDFADPDGSFRWFSGHSIPLTGSLFSGARFDGVHLDQADISLADFTGASMIRVGMGFVLAAYTSFRGADLADADLWQLKAYQCDFAGARLMGATLRGVSAVECRFERADFTEATLGTADATRGQTLRLRSADAAASRSTVQAATPTTTRMPHTPGTVHVTSQDRSDSPRGSNRWAQRPVDCLPLRGARVLPRCPPTP